MPQSTLEQIAELIERQDAHEQRLRILQLQHAQRGSSAPPELIIEVADIQREVFEIAIHVSKLQAQASKAEYRTFVAQNTIELADVSLQLASSTESIQRVQQVTFRQVLQWFDQDKETREHRQHVTNLFYAAILIMLALDIAIRYLK